MEMGTDETYTRTIGNVSQSHEIGYLEEPPGDSILRNKDSGVTSLNIELGWFNESLAGVPSMNTSTGVYPGIANNSTSSISSSITTTDNYTVISDLFVFDDLNDYINRLNYSAFANLTAYYNGTNFNFSAVNCTSSFVNGSFRIGECGLSSGGLEKFNGNNWWALLLVVVPCLTIFGNVLVILAVIRERALQTVTNYFILSLALADLLVAVLVMPFAVYVLVNAGTWSLPSVVCDFYIAMDVMCSTSSIFNLVAISIDRYIAVTKPIKYAKHKNNRRVWMTILLVWAISVAIGSPIVLGLNNTPDRSPDLCLFYNTDFIIYSSLSSFYIPCIIMVFLYYNIFKALRNRARKSRVNKRSNLGDTKLGCTIENIAHTGRFAETALGAGAAALVAPVTEEPTNTASGSNEDEDETPIDGAGVISNDKSTEYFLATVAEEAACRFSAMAKAHLNTGSNNAKNDSRYDGASSATMNHDPLDTNSSPSPNPRITSAPSSSTSSSPPPQRGASSSQIKKNGNSTANKQELKRFQSSGSLLPLSAARSNVLSSSVSCKDDRKNPISGSRFTMCKANKASKKKREKASAKKERKATKTLAIVLGVFLICWVPFFTCNIMDAICVKLEKECQPGVIAFIATSWLGYINSFVNPVIYTVFNPEFRKAFRKLINV